MASIPICSAFCAAMLRWQMFAERKVSSKRRKKSQTLSREIFLFCRNFVWIGFCCFVSNFKLKCPLSYSFFMLHFSISFILQRKHLHRHWVLWFLKGQDEILAFHEVLSKLKKNMSEKLCGLQSDALINNVILFHFIYSI